MKIIILTFLITLLPTYAKIGMTKDQCDKQYGKAKPNELLGFTYKHNNLEISTYFTKGICSQVSYVSEKKFTKEEQAKLIKENCKEKYKFSHMDKESKIYFSKNFSIECKPSEIIITSLKLVMPNKKN